MCLSCSVLHRPRSSCYKATNIFHGTSTDLTNCIKHNEIKSTGNFTVPTNFLRTGLLNANKTSTEDFRNMHLDKNQYRKIQRAQIRSCKLCLNKDKGQWVRAFHCFTAFPAFLVSPVFHTPDIPYKQSNTNHQSPWQTPAVLQSAWDDRMVR